MRAFDLHGIGIILYGAFLSIADADSIARD